MKKSIILAVSFSLLFIVCGKGTIGKRSAVIEEIDGITYVHNIGEPQYPDRTVEFLEEVTFGSEEDEVLLGNPAYFSVRSNGNVYIGDFSEKNIKVYNSEGDYIKTVGKEGQGPGEFQTSPILRFLEDGRMLALDMISRRCSFYDKNDNLVESFNWEGYKAILHAISDTLMIFTEMSMDRETMESKYKLGQRVIIKPVQSQSSSARDSDIEQYAGQSGVVTDFYWIRPSGGEVFYVYTVKMVDS